MSLESTKVDNFADIQHKSSLLIDRKRTSEVNHTWWGLNSELTKLLVCGVYVYIVWEIN